VTKSISEGQNQREEDENNRNESDEISAAKGRSEGIERK